MADSVAFIFTLLQLPVVAAFLTFAFAKGKGTENLLLVAVVVNVVAAAGCCCR